jgi:hypothetical protein
VASARSTLASSTTLRTSRVSVSIMMQPSFSTSMVIEARKVIRAHLLVFQRLARLSGIDDIAGLRRLAMAESGASLFAM